MKLIIPMAGRGTRVRPHSHVTPKPLLSVCGKSMVQRIVETFADVLPRPITEAVYILGPDFGEGVRKTLTDISTAQGIQAHFAVQFPAEGTAHAVVQAGDHLSGEGIIVFADTLFYMDEDAARFDGADAVAWVKHVDDPRRFGVAMRDPETGNVTAFIEKPTEIISTEALIGIYWLRELADFRREAQYLIDHDIKGNGEYQLTDAMDRMLKGGAVFRTASVSEWLDCGTIPALLETTKVIMEKEHTDSVNSRVEGSVVMAPVYVGPGATIRNSVIGPHASIEAGATVDGSVIRESVVFAKAKVEGSVLAGSFVGQSAHVLGATGPLNVGDHATVGIVE